MTETSSNNRKEIKQIANQKLPKRAISEKSCFLEKIPKF